jgi:hypothetical protein
MGSFPVESVVASHLVNKRRDNKQQVYKNPVNKQPVYKNPVNKQPVKPSPVWLPFRNLS